jgi:hypothetical protein
MPVHIGVHRAHIVMFVQLNRQELSKFIPQGAATPDRLAHKLCKKILFHTTIETHHEH